MSHFYFYYVYLLCVVIGVPVILLSFYVEAKVHGYHVYLNQVLTPILACFIPVVQLIVVLSFSVSFIEQFLSAKNWNFIVFRAKDRSRF